MRSVTYDAKRLFVGVLIGVFLPSLSLAQNGEVIGRYDQFVSERPSQFTPKQFLVATPEGSRASTTYFSALDFGLAGTAGSVAGSVMIPNEHWADVNRRLRRFTLAGLWLTTALGTVGIINRPTLFGDGRCETGGPIFGDYGCGPSTTLHGISAGTSMVLFTAGEVIDLTTGVQRNDSKNRRVLRWVARAGMAVLPLVGIISRFPDVIGIDDPESQAEFSRTVRTLHAGAGYVTVGAYTATFLVD